MAEELNVGPFDPDPKGVELKKRILLAVFVGIMGISASIGAVYFLKNEGVVEPSLGAIVKVRETPERIDSVTKRRLVHTPQLSLPSNNLVEQSNMQVAETPDGVSESEEPRFGALILSEVQIAGVSAADEFVELFNPNDFTVSLDGWAVRRKSSSGKEYPLVTLERLKGKSVAGRGYFLIASEHYSGEVPADAVWAASNSIAADNTVLLYATHDDDIILVDKLGFGAALDFEGSVAPNPGPGETLSRVAPDDTDNNGRDFIVSVPSPRNSSSAGAFEVPSRPVPASPSDSPGPSPVLSPQPTPSPSPIASLAPSPNPSPSPVPSPSFGPSPSPPEEPTPSPLSHPKILINEIQIAGLDANDEFIELYNPSVEAIDLSGWSIQYRGGQSTQFYKKNFGSGHIIPPGGYFLVARSDSVNFGHIADMSHSSFALSGVGGTVFIVSNQAFLMAGTEASIIDKVAYGEGNYLFPEETPFVPAPKANTSIQRRNFQDTDNNAIDFESQMSPSPRNAAGV